MNRYFVPKRAEEAVSLLVSYAPRARLLAGGTDLVCDSGHMLRDDLVLIDVTSIEGLSDIQPLDNGGLRVGAGVTHAQVCGSEVIRHDYPCLWEASSAVGSVQVRNLGTVAGNLCNGSPAADTAPPLMALGATLELLGPEGKRAVPLVSFFAGPKETHLRPAEMLTAILLSPPRLAGGSAYVKLGRRKAMDLALASAAVTMTGQFPLIHCAIALGSVAPTPVRAFRAEGLFERTAPSAEFFKEVAGRVAEECYPIADVRATARYRSLMIPVVTELALGRAWERLRRLSWD